MCLGMHARSRSHSTGCKSDKSVRYVSPCKFPTQAAGANYTESLLAQLPPRLILSIEPAISDEPTEPAATLPSPAALSLARRLGWGAVWVILGRGMGIVANVLIGAALARLLAPADAGAFVIALNVIMFGGTIGAFGLGNASVRFISEHLARGDRSGARRVVRLALGLISGTSLATASLLGLALWLGGAEWLRLDSSLAVLVLVVLAMALWSWQQVAAESLRGYHELRFASFLSGGASGGPLANVVFLSLVVAASLYTRLDLRWTIGFVAVGLAVSLPITLLLLRRTTRATTASHALDAAGDAEFSLGTLLKVCLPILALQVLAFITLWADLWTAGAICEPEQVALYGFARRLVTLVALPTQLAMLTVLSSIPDLYSRGRLKELQQILRRTALLAAIPSVAAATALIVAPRPILGLYYAPFYQEAAGPLAIMAAGQVVVILCGVGGYTLMMTGRHNAALLVNLLTATFAIVASPLAAWRFGIVGLAVVAATAAILQAGLEWLLVRRLIGVWTHVGMERAPQ